MKKLVSFILLTLILVFAFAAVSMADFYAFTDSSGKMHISNAPKSARYVMIIRETREIKAAKHREASLDRIIKVKSEKYGVDPALVKALIKAESNFKSSAVSEDGARGLMQLMPETAQEMGVADRADPEENIDGGVRYLSRLLRVFGSDTGLAIAAYNAGEQAVLRYGAIPPFAETRDYVKKVLQYYNDYSPR